MFEPVIVQHIHEYEEYLWVVIDGHLGLTGQFWAARISLINHLQTLHRDVQRVCQNNDVEGNIQVLLEVYFALNLLKYARSGTLFKMGGVQEGRFFSYMYWIKEHWLQ